MDYTTEEGQNSLLSRDQQVSVVAVSSAKAAMASIIITNVPNGHFRTIALDRLEEACMWAVTGITSGERPEFTIAN